MTLALPQSQHLTLQSAIGAGLRPSPYGREIFLLDAYVAGTSYLDDVRVIEACIEAGTVLTCRREPANPRDPLAIRLDTAGGQKAGYVPRKWNEILARLLDAGKRIEVRVRGKRWEQDWLRIDVALFLIEL